MENIKSLTVEEVKKLHESKTRMAIVEIMAIEHKHELGSKDMQIICDAIWDEVEECSKQQYQSIVILRYINAPMFLQEMKIYRPEMTEEEKAEWGKCIEIISDLEYKIKYAVQDYIIKAYKEREEWKNKNLKWN